MFITCKQVVARTYVSGYVCETFGCRLSQSGCRLAIDSGTSGDANARAAAWSFITCKQVVARTYASGYVCVIFVRDLSKVRRCLPRLDAIRVAQKLNPPPGYFAPGKQVIACYYVSSYFR